MILVVFFFKKEIRGHEMLILCNFVNTLLIAFREELVEFGFGDDSRKDLKVIHEFGEFREGDLVFGLGIKVENAL